MGRNNGSSALDGQGSTVSQGVFGQWYGTSASANQPPVVTAPSTQSVTQGNTLTFSSAGSNAISIADPDGGAATEQFTLTASNGTLTLASTTGLSFVAGTGTGDTTVTVDGSLANLDAALNGLLLAPAANFSGTDTVQITANDLGNAGTGGAKTDTTSVSVAVTPIAYTPTVTDSTSSGLGAQTTSGLVISQICSTPR
jgi:hypothetical protein